jgi:hypothetical protein
MTTFWQIPTFLLFCESPKVGRTRVGTEHFPLHQQGLQGIIHHH